MPIRKALSVDGESKAVNYLLHGEYEMTNTSWSKLQKKYNLSKNKIYSALKEKEDPEDPSTGKRKSKPLNQNQPCLILILEWNKT